VIPATVPISTDTQGEWQTVTETFSSPASLAKAKREVSEGQRFRQLGDQLLDVSERICQLQPVEESSP
jgi:hypothetical protein